MKKVGFIFWVVLLMGCTKVPEPPTSYAQRDGIVDLEQRFARTGSGLYASNQTNLLFFPLNSSGIAGAATQVSIASQFSPKLMGLQVQRNDLFLQLRDGHIFWSHNNDFYVVGHTQDKGSFSLSDSLLVSLTRSNSDAKGILEIFKYPNNLNWEDRIYQAGVAARSVVSLDNEHFVLLDDVSKVYHLVNDFPVPIQDLQTPAITHLRKAGNYWYASAGPVVDIYEWNGASLIKLGSL